MFSCEFSEFFKNLFHRTHPGACLCHYISVNVYNAKSAETVRLRKISSPGNQVEKLVFYEVILYIYTIIDDEVNKSKHLFNAVKFFSLNFFFNADFF